MHALLSSSQNLNFKIYMATAAARTTAGRKPTGVTLDPAVLKYLDDLRKVRPYDRFSRSSLINMIIEEHAEGKGTPLFPHGATSGEGVNG